MAPGLNGVGEEAASRPSERGTPGWWEISLVSTPEAAEAVAEVFHRFAPGGVAIEALLPDSPLAPGAPSLRVVAYLPVDDALPQARRHLQEALGHLSLIVPLPSLQERQIPDQDWLRLWRDTFRPFRVGQRLVVKPPWLALASGKGAPAPGDIVIQIDPGMAFGTGLHPTTQMCLEALEGWLQPGMAVLDLGTGSGILSIAAARLGAASVLALDKDPVAVKAAQDNLTANGIPPGVVTVAQGTLAPGKSQTGYDLVVANLNAAILERLAGPVLAALVPGGLLIAGGILEDQAEAVAAAYQEAGAALVATTARDDWRTLFLRQPR